MQPVAFKQANVTFAKDQKQYQPLPSYRASDATGTVISCWRLTWGERIYLLFSGRLWLSQLTYYSPLQPQLPQVESPFDSSPIK